MFSKENCPEKKSNEEESDNNNGNDGEWEFVERYRENAEHPKKSEPDSWAFFVGWPRKTDIEIAS